LVRWFACAHPRRVPLVATVVPCIRLGIEPTGRNRCVAPREGIPAERDLHGGPCDLLCIFAFAW
jgi:hypothetical protein